VACVPPAAACTCMHWWGSQLCNTVSRKKMHTTTILLPVYTAPTPYARGRSAFLKFALLSRIACHGEPISPKRCKPTNAPPNRPKCETIAHPSFLIGVLCSFSFLRGVAPLSSVLVRRYMGDALAHRSRAHVYASSPAASPNIRALCGIMARAIIWVSPLQTHVSVGQPGANARRVARLRHPTLACCKVFGHGPVGQPGPA
jgi:hypothetical protein